MAGTEGSGRAVKGMGEEPPAGRGAFERRRAAVLEELGEDAMVLPAAPPLYRSRDSELRYRPDSELHYLSGFPEPEAVLVLRAFADEERVVLFARSRDAAQEQWSGPRLGPEGARRRLGIDAAYPVGDLAGRLPGLLAGARRVHFRLGAHPWVEPLVLEALRTARRRGPRTGSGPRGVTDPGGILDELRLRKDAGEIEALRRAVQVTIQGFRAGLAATGPGVGEWEVEAATEAAFRRAEARSPAFATIVGSGPNACILHYVENSRRVAAGELVLLDAGAEVGMYAGDLTRTVPASGHFSPEQRAVYEVVEAARVAAVERVRPGATVREVHEAAVEVLTRGLVELGVYAGPARDLVERRAYRRFFPHRTSHWLGLDTHDPGDYACDGSARALEAGMVLTVEPGLYFISAGGASPPAPEEEAGGEAPAEEVPVLAHPFTGIGVRIEDDVLVTSDGAEVLSADLPTDPDRIAELVGGDG